jgi:hypothetical protein
MSVFVKSLRFWFALFMTLVTLAFVIMALGYSPMARLFPLIVGIPTFIAGVLTCLSVKWPVLIRPFDVNIGMSVKVVAEGVEKEEAVEEAAPELSNKGIAKRVFALLGWIAGYLVVILFFGFNISNFLMVTGYMMVHPKMKWWKAIIYGLVTAFILWFMFEYTMKGDIFQGILFGELMPIF